jgi:large subunit ribosomal protein L17
MRKLGRKKSNREHMIRNLATSLILFETIDTTLAKAKDVKIYTEKLISACKKQEGLNAIRKASTVFFDKNATKKMIDELLPRYKDRQSGFITSFKIKNRAGDNSEMMRLELMDKKVFVDKKADKEVKAKESVKEIKLAKATKEIKK